MEIDPKTVRRRTTTWMGRMVVTRPGFLCRHRRGNNLKKNPHRDCTQNTHLLPLVPLSNPAPAAWGQ